MAVNVTQQLKQTNALFATISGDSSSDIAANNALLHELQLGKQLNHCVVETRRADFSLMLAMLAEDVREQSQFLVPKAPVASEPDFTNKALRKEFNLPDKAPLALNSLDDIEQFNQVQTVVNEEIASLHLLNALQPKPLAFRDDKNHINSDVTNNMSLFTQLKLKQAQAKQETVQTKVINEDVVNTDKTLSEPLNFNAKAWLASIEESIVKAPLMN